RLYAANPPSTVSNRTSTGSMPSRSPERSVVAAFILVHSVCGRLGKFIEGLDLLFLSFGENKGVSLGRGSDENTAGLKSFIEFGLLVRCGLRRPSGLWPGRARER